MKYANCKRAAQEEGWVYLGESDFRNTRTGEEVSTLAFDERDAWVYLCEGMSIDVEEMA